MVAEVAQASSTATKITTITGHISGRTAPYGLLIATAPGNRSFSGTGRAAPIGTVYFGTQMKEILSSGVLTIPTGTANLTTIHGEQIALAYGGNGTTTSQGWSSFTLQGLVTSGTGRFDGVTGNFGAAVSVTRGGRFTMDFSMSLNYPTNA
jgi:hypothetical protein